MTLVIFIPLISFVLNVIFQVIAVQYRISEWYLGLMLKSFAVGMLPLLLYHGYGLYMEQNILAENISLFMANLIIYSLLCYLFISIVGSGVSSLRVRMLYEISIQPHGLTVEELLINFNSEFILNSRLERLMESRHVSCVNGRYFLNKKLILYITIIIKVLRDLVFGRQNLKQYHDEFLSKSHHFKKDD